MSGCPCFTLCVPPFPGGGFHEVGKILRDIHFFTLMDCAQRRKVVDGIINPLKVPHAEQKDPKLAEWAQACQEGKTLDGVLQSRANDFVPADLFDEVCKTPLEPILAPLVPNFLESPQFEEWGRMTVFLQSPVSESNFVVHRPLGKGAFPLCVCSARVFSSSLCGLVWLWLWMWMWLWLWL